MSFRDDHDAAIARIDSLEQALAEMAADKERDANEIARLKRQIARLEGKEDATVTFTPPSREPQLPTWITMASKVLGLVVFTMLAMIIILGATAPG
jgi:hypothetical protein